MRSAECEGCDIQQAVGVLQLVRGEPVEVGAEQEREIVELVAERGGHVGVAGQRGELAVEQLVALQFAE